MFGFGRRNDLQVKTRCHERFIERLLQERELEVFVKEIKIQKQRYNKHTLKKKGRLLDKTFATIFTCNF